MSIKLFEKKCTKKYVCFFFLVFILNNMWVFAGQKEELIKYIEKCNIYGVKELIKVGIDLEPSDESKDISNYNPIQVAVAKNNLEILKVLVESTSNIDLNKLIGDSIVVALKNQKMMDYIISKGYDINTYFIYTPPVPENWEPTPERLTPLGYSARINDVRTMKYLFSKGAKYLVEVDGKFYVRARENPLLIACNENNEDIVKYIVSLKYITKEDLSEALFFVSNKEIAEILLKKGADCNYERIQYNNYGGDFEMVDTPFYCAIDNGSFVVANLMLKYKANVNQMIRPCFNVCESKPMVYYLERTGNYKGLEFLRKAGANMGSLLDLQSWQWWYCDDYDNCIEKVSLIFQNKTMQNVRQATIILSIKNKENENIIYKKKHIINVNLDKDETGSSQEFYLSNKVYAYNSTTFEDDYEFEVEVLSIK